VNTFSRGPDGVRKRQIKQCAESGYCKAVSGKKKTGGREAKYLGRGRKTKEAPEKKKDTFVYKSVREGNNGGERKEFAV